MSARVRTSVFLVAAIGLAALLLWGLAGLPSFGNYRGPYGDVLNRVAVPQRHVTDVVAAVNFDYRGLDTIGEEFILFACVSAVTLLLRTEREELDVEPPEDVSEEMRTGTSAAVRAYGHVLVAPVVVLGIYIITHGHLTPGGGFQGGAILASAFLLLYLGGAYRTLRRLCTSERTDIFDAIGAGGFVVIGLAGLLAGGAYLQNVLPLGPVGELYSSGMIPLINLSVGLEVGAGFVLIILEFLRQTLQVRENVRARQRSSGGDERRLGGPDQQTDHQNRGPA
jgi:multicomponent Na+:H+ antiporter subunit B